jgi:hypothetical protein
MLSRAFVALALVAATFAAPVVNVRDVTTGNVGSFNEIEDVHIADITGIVTTVKDNVYKNQANAGVASIQNNNQKRTEENIVSDNILSYNSIHDIGVHVGTWVSTWIKDNLTHNQANVGVGSIQNNSQKRDITTDNVLSGNSIHDIEVLIYTTIITWIKDNVTHNQANVGVGSIQNNSQKRDVTSDNILTGNSIHDIAVHIATLILTDIKDNVKENQLNVGVASVQDNNQKRSDVTTGNVLSFNELYDVCVSIVTDVLTHVGNNGNNNQVNVGVASVQNNSQ